VPDRRPGRRLVRVVALVTAVIAVGAIALFGWRAQAPGSSTAAVPQFVDVTATAGVAHTYDGDSGFEVGGGVAVLDCNDDGRPDLYVAGGANAAALFRNDSPTGGAITFAPLPDPVTDRTGVNGAYPIDVDGDGHVDLVVLRSGGNAVLRGLGDCRFADATSTWGLQPGSRHTEAFSATWEAGSSWPTVAFGNYQDPAIADPAAWCEPNVFIRPAASGTGFGAETALTPSWCSLSMLFSDWDGSGRMDLRVSNDAHYYPADVGEEQLWRIEPGVAPRSYGAADGWASVQVEGMGIGSYDLTGDGLPEIFLTSQAANRLQTLATGPSQPAYADIGLKRGVNVAHPAIGPDQALPSTAWHAEFQDVNNDGFVDLFVSKGNVGQQPDYAIHDPSNLLLGQSDGTFREAADAAGITTFDRGRGAALVDLNLDGRLDLVEVFLGAPMRIWRNAPPAGGAEAEHWLALRAEQPSPNVDAIGAWLEVDAGGTTQRRELTIGGGHGGGQLGWVHVGLGAATTARVRVRWPGNEAGPWQDVAADTFDILGRGASQAVVWTPPAS
jgi:hypothetical protein